MDQKKSEDQLLSKALGAWRVTETLPPRFQERVWSRIEQAESIRADSFFAQVLAWANQAFAKPAIATAYIGLLLVGGLMAGHMKANAEQTKQQSQLAAKYVQAVDPYGRLEP